VEAMPQELSPRLFCPGTSAFPPLFFLLLPRAGPPFYLSPARAGEGGHKVSLAFAARPPLTFSRLVCSFPRPQKRF
jgi:hypothetical protein